MSGRPHGPIDREEAQAGLPQLEDAGVGDAEQLVRALGGGVERDRMIGRIVERERHLLRCAVDRAGAGIDQVLQLRRQARHLQHVEMAVELARTYSSGCSIE
jgi:hypothetical protein